MSCKEILFNVIFFPLYVFICTALICIPLSIGVMIGDWMVGEILTFLRWMLI